MSKPPCPCCEGAKSDAICGDPCWPCQGTGNATEANAGQIISDLHLRLATVEVDRDEWKGQVLGIRAQQREALARAEAAESKLRHLTRHIGNGDDLDVAAGRCCPICRSDLAEHNRAVWNAGYSMGHRHANDDEVDA